MPTDELPARDWITATPSVLDGKPRIEGRRLGVRFLATQVADEGNSRVEVAERYELPVEAVDAAVAYYHSHPAEMGEIEKRRRETLARAQADPAIPTTPEAVADTVGGSRSTSD